MVKIVQRNALSCSLLIILFIFYGIFGCQSGKQQKQRELSVFAAMSLSDALTEIGTQFAEDHEIRVHYNFAASSTIQRQIEKGASADIFISASPIQVNALNVLGLLEDETRTDVLTNRLVVVSQNNTEITMENLKEIQDTSIKRIAMGHPEIVPAGSYAKEALEHFELWEKVKPKLIFGTDVRATLAYLTSGNVDIAIVYETDTKVTNKVKVLFKFPKETHSRIVYPAVILRGSHEKVLAETFLTFLKEPTATVIFQQHGFTCLSPTSAIRRRPDLSQ
jgi:molybdate transport system substrate-binding protein